jgi:tetratricopeptide (TPR) repeat protein
LYLSVLAAPAGAAGAFAPQAPGAPIASRDADPDALYAGRADLASVQKAFEIWESRLKSAPGDFESAWKIARAAYWLGGHLPEARRRAALERGIEAGTAASAIEPNRPEGHFWTAANMGALAESFGVRAGLRYRGPIKRELETVLRIDPGFQKGSADRALGRWYYKVPGLFGGSRKQSELHLRKSLTYDPQSTASRYFLAETLVGLDREDEARAELRKVLDAPLDPEWTPEDLEFKAKARKLLEEM